VFKVMTDRPVVINAARSLGRLAGDLSIYLSWDK